MLTAEQKRFDRLYARHLQALKLQGKSKNTIDAYGRAVRRVAQRFDCCPDRLTTPQLQSYFAELVDSHSWSTVKVDRNGLQFFWKHVLKRDIRRTVRSEQPIWLAMSFINMPFARLVSILMASVLLIIGTLPGFHCCQQLLSGGYPG